MLRSSKIRRAVAVNRRKVILCTRLCTLASYRWNIQKAAYYPRGINANVALKMLAYIPRVPAFHRWKYFFTPNGTEVSTSALFFPGASPFFFPSFHRFKPVKRKKKQEEEEEEEEEEETKKKKTGEIAFQGIAAALHCKAWQAASDASWKCTRTR